MSSIPTLPASLDAFSDHSNDSSSGNGHTSNHDTTRPIASNNDALVLSINRLTFVMRDELREIRTNLRSLLQISESLARLLNIHSVHSPDYDFHSTSCVTKDPQEPLTLD